MDDLSGRTALSLPECPQRVAHSIGRRNTLMKSQIMEPDDLPALGDEAGIFAFAMTFNGYEAFGSFDGAAKSARQRKRESLEDVRNELFMAARASRHSGSKSYLATYEELLPYLKRYVSK